MAEAPKPRPGPTLLTDAVVGVTPWPHVTPGIKDQTQNLLRGEWAWLGGTEGEALGEQAEGLHTSCGPHDVGTALRLRCLCPSGCTPMSDPGTRLRQLHVGSSESSLAALDQSWRTPGGRQDRRFRREREARSAVSIRGQRISEQSP